MGKVLIDESNLQAIADSIRSKNGTQETYLPSEMSIAIDNISGGNAKINPNGEITYSRYGRYAASLIEEMDLNERVFSGYMSIDLWFGYFPYLKNIKNFNVKESDGVTITSCSQTFRDCPFLESGPEMNTKRSSTFLSMYYGCTNLKNVPVYKMGDNSNVEVRAMYTNCPSLTNQSLSNIIDSLITLGVSYYQRTKTLAYVGLSQEQANYCITLPNWSILVDRGWTTGYEE